MSRVGVGKREVMREFRIEIQALEPAPWIGAEPGVKRDTSRPKVLQVGEATMTRGGRLGQVLVRGVLVTERISTG